MTSLHVKINKYEKLIKTDISKSDKITIEKKCHRYLNDTNNKLQKLINMFNTLVKEITDIIYTKFPNKSNKMYKNVISDIMSKKPTEFIIMFINNIYVNDEYREYLIEGNDLFFMTSKFDDNLKLISKLREYWNRLDIEYKDFIKDSMKTLIQIVEQYIVEKDNGSRLLAILTNI
jgi:hypothetical protein